LGTWNVWEMRHILLVLYWFEKMKRLHQLERKWENDIDLKRKKVEDFTSLNCVRFEVPGALSIRLIVMLTLVAASVNETLLGQTYTTLPGRGCGDWACLARCKTLLSVGVLQYCCCTAAQRVIKVEHFQ
jgi:hypothetical protein